MKMNFHVSCNEFYDFLSLDKDLLKAAKSQKNTNLNARTDFLFEFLQLLGRHTTQFFCRALAALRIVEIVTNKVTALHLVQQKLSSIPPFIFC